MQKPIITRINVLDGWRTIAVGLVIISHLAFRSTLAPILPQVRMGIYPYGHLGVLIFFVLSGYVITNGLIAKTELTGRVPSISSFAVRRLMRIVPPLMLYLFICLILEKTHIIVMLPHDITSAVLFSCNFVPCGTYVGHTWSLAYEEQFYLIFPFLFIALINNLRLFALALVIFVVTGMVTTFAFDWLTFFQSVTAIGVGVTCAIYSDQLLKVLRNVPSIGVPAGLVALLVYATASTQFIECFGNKIAVAIDLVVPFLLISALLMTSIARPDPFTQVLASAPVTTIGRSTYGIYLWQQLTTGTFAGATPVLNIILTLLLIPFCLITYRWFDQPFIRLGRIISARLEAQSFTSGTCN